MLGGGVCNGQQQALRVKQVAAVKGCGGRSGFE